MEYSTLEWHLLGRGEERGRSGGEELRRDRRSREERLSEWGIGWRNEWIRNKWGGKTKWWKLCILCVIDGH
jgi:hypothetical protein